MASKRPVYFDEAREGDFYENTPKHVLYALARDFAAQLMGSDDLNDTTALVVALSTMQNRVGILQMNGVLP